MDTTLDFSGGTLSGPGETCTFSVTLDVPSTATAGSYPNTTSSVTSDLGTEAPASDVLVVSPIPSELGIVDSAMVTQPSNHTQVTLYDIQKSNLSPGFREGDPIDPDAGTNIEYTLVSKEIPVEDMVPASMGEVVISHLPASFFPYLIEFSSGTL